MTFSSFDHECMALALRLARNGLFTTDPNPRVGCVIARGETILGRGWHERAGGPHAEVNALEDAAGAQQGATAYVTLEPCAHQGRTPPCTDALLEAGLGRVVIASEDPNPGVKGGGAARLREAGVAVETGLLAAEAEELNCGFLMRTRSGRPWIRVKTATSLDGRTALRNGVSQWISGEDSRRDVQRWRARSSAILTGIGTVLADDPRMDVRLDGTTRQPLKVVADSQWRIPPHSRILSGSGPALVAGDRSKDGCRALQDLGVSCLELPGSGDGVDLPALMRELAALEINEVQVEAGARLCGSLMRHRLVDEILIYQAPVLLGDGGPGPFALGPLESMRDRLHLRVLETTRIGADLRWRLAPPFRP